jgi:hypothetical protein
MAGKLPNEIACLKKMQKIFGGTLVPDGDGTKLILNGKAFCCAETLLSVDGHKSPRTYQWHEIINDEFEDEGSEEFSIHDGWERITQYFRTYAHNAFSSNRGVQYQ